MTKKPDLADINARNQEFWAEESRKFAERLAKRPHDLKHVIEKTHERIEDGAFKKVRSLESQMAELDGLRNQDQSVRSRGKTRQRARGHREIAIDVMRRARSQQRTYKEFMASEWDEITFNIVPGEGEMSYDVYCGILEPRDESDSQKAAEAATERFSDKTIQGWWSAAGKRNPELAG